MRWLALLVALACTPLAAQEPPSWFTPSFLDIREDVAEAAKEGRRLMIYFHQDGCPYCKQLVETTFADARVARRMQRELSAIDINIYGDREVTWTDGRRMPEKRFAELMRVRGTPTLVFFDDKGVELRRITGYLPPGEFLAALDRAL